MKKEEEEEMKQSGMFDMFLRHFRRKMFVKDFTFDGKGSFFKNLIQDFGLDFGQGAIRTGKEKKGGKTQTRTLFRSVTDQS